jgi:DnaJ-domain-containing protein 1
MRAEMKHFEMKHEDACRILGIAPEANDEEIRSAYLRKVKEHPPDRAGQEFERVRDAYEVLRDPRKRVRNMIMSINPRQRLASLLDERQAERRFTGPDPWLAVLREKKR